MDIKDIIAAGQNPGWAINELKRKAVYVPAWTELEKAYDAKKHPVMDKQLYPDKITKRGIEKVTRITLGLPKLAVKRITELMFAIPVQRVYKPQTDEEKRVGELMEAILTKNRVDAQNIERGRYLFAACEAVTLWYAQEQDTDYAGEHSRLKLRCKNYSPMNGDALYPLFDEYDDLVALSVEYRRRENDLTVTYFDTYTADEHVRWRTDGGAITEDVRERIELQKIPGIYIMRPEPIWEDEAENVYEAEWTLSRNGNYIRKNARPNWVVFSDNKVKFGKEPANDNAGRNVLQYGKDDKAQYVTWTQAIESIKYHVDEIRRNFFMQLQLPDMSMENMKATPMSGEARKMMFIDAQMKVTDESGIWLEFFDRELNVVRAFMKKMFPRYAAAIDSLQVEVVITPYQIRDEAERISNLSNATGGKPIMSQKTAIANLGYVDDVDAELEQIKSETTVNLFEEPTI
ncbi:MAG: phage portal protein [Roseburia sp.]|nr:phage portal protein [Roseburia sp.]